MGSLLDEFFTTEGTERSGRSGMIDDARIAARDPWPIGRFLAHSRSWASRGRSLALGEKSQSATLRSKECERNRFLNCSSNTEAQRHKGTELMGVGMSGLCDSVSLCLCVKTCAPALEQAVRFRFHSFKRSADDLGFFAIGKGRHLNGRECEWRKRRIIGRILRSDGWSVPLSSAGFRAFRSKKPTLRASVSPCEIFYPPTGEIEV